MQNLLDAVEVRKSFGGVQALRGVSFQLRPGEVHALVGENGAGKSTLIRIIAGALEPDSGEIHLHGASAGRLTPARAQQLGIRCVYQQPALFPHLSVAENIALALDPHRPLGRVDWPARRRKAEQLLGSLGAAIPVDREVAALTMPEQQLVEIAKAIGAGARILILDEPTACLSHRETESLFAAIAGIKASGAGVIYISHRLEELARIAGRVTILRDGQTVAARAMAETSRAELIQLMVGRDVAAVYPKVASKVAAPVLELRNAGCRGAGLAGIHLTVRAGEIVGLAGLVGSGRTELANMIFGLTPIDEGEMLLEGKRASVESPAQARDLGIGYVPEDRRRVGVIGAMPIAGNITLPILPRVSRSGFLDSAKETAIAEGYRRQLGVKADSVDVLVETLSGGNQQKVALAKWLAVKPRLIILDEPTQGVDVGAKAEVHRLISELAAGGMAVLMISSDLPEVLGMSDRVVVMSGGRVAGELARGEATQERILALALTAHSGGGQ